MNFSAQRLLPALRPLRLTRSRPTAVLCAALCLSGAGFAQDGDIALDRPAQPPTPPGAANAAGPTLAEVTVTADSATQAPPVYAGGQVARGARLGLLGNTDIMDAPFSITAYTARTIEDQQARSIADVLANDASARAASPASYSLEFYNLRGFLLWGYDVSLSGMYGVLPYGRIPVEMAERVEVLRGPSAMLYGQAPSGAVGGAINVVPKRADDEPLTRLSTSYVSDAQAGIAVDLGRRFGDDKQWGIRVNASTGSGDTPMDGQSLRHHLGSVALDYRGERLRFSLDAYETRYRTQGGVGNFASFSTPYVLPAPDASTNFFPGTWGDTRDHGTVVRGEVDITDSLTGYIGAGTRHYHSSSYLSSAARNVNADGTFSGNLYPTTNDDDTVSLEGGLRGRFATGPVKHEWTLGGTSLSIHAWQSITRPTPFYVSNIYAPVQMPLTGTDYPTVPLSDTQLDSVAFADTMSFADDRIRLTLGARNQRVVVKGFSPLSRDVDNPLSRLTYQSSHYSREAVTPMAGVVFKPVANVSVYANYIEGLTSGSQVTDPNATNYGEVFAPLKTRQKEVGLKWNLGRWSNTFALYEIRKPSLINVYTGASYAVDGSGEQHNRGVEWSTFGEVARGVRVLGGVAYTDAKLTRTARGINQGNDAFASPPWKINLGVEWDAPFAPGLTFSALAIHNSAQWLNSANTQRVPSWTRYDLGARYATQIGAKPVTFRATVQNATDTAYWDASWRDGLAILNTPRTFLLSASVDF